MRPFFCIKSGKRDMDKKTIEAAASLFEQANGNVLDDYEKKLLADTGLENAQPEDVVSQLIEFVENARPTEPGIGFAIWALGKRFDPHLKKFFISCLKRALDPNPNALWQTIIALDNLEEEILPGGGAVHDEERNRQLAEDYLKRLE